MSPAFRTFESVAEELCLKGDPVRTLTRLLKAHGVDFVKAGAQRLLTADQYHRLKAAMGGKPIPSGADLLAAAKRQVAQVRMSERAEAGEAPGSIVYFIQMKYALHVKVGVSEVSAGRLRTLQTGNPEPLTVIASMPGSYRGERALHAALAPWRLEGEWFRWNDRLAEIVTRANAGQTFKEIGPWLREMSVTDWREALA